MGGRPAGSPEEKREWAVPLALRSARSCPPGCPPELSYTPEGKPVQRMRTFDREREALAWGREQDSAREHGTLANAGKLTLGEYLAQWLERCERRIRQQTLRGTTVAGYRTIITHYVTPDTAHGRVRARMRMDRLTPAHCQAIIDAAPTSYTATRARVILRIAVGEAERLGILPSNPVRRTAAPAHQAKEGAAWTDAQARAFLAVTRAEHYAACWYLAVHTGLRPSELYGLRWDRLDLDEGVLRIEQGRVHLFGGVYEDGPKGAKERRRIDLPAAVVAVLRAWRAAQAEEQLLLGSRGRAVSCCSLPRRAGR
jgi:integrase